MNELNGAGMAGALTACLLWFGVGVELGWAIWGNDEPNHPSLAQREHEALLRACIRLYNQDDTYNSDVAGCPDAVNSP